ncbi:MAG: FAD-binding oxidoreductase [Myxococcota bacterium]|nr:FAD-binding oxidoreductase [Myxococcota bacterium]
MTAPPSYWMALDPSEPGPPLRGTEHVDVAIVGGGFTGLWTAYHLSVLEPAMRVAIVEANVVGHGASGRNAGFAMTLVHRSLAELVRALGDEGAAAVVRAAARSVRAIGEVCRAEGIDADLQPNGLLTVSNGPLQDGLVRLEAETADRLGLEGIRYLEGAEVRARVHSETFRCGLFDEACTLLNPARLVRGLRRVVERRGVAVYERSELADITRDARRIRLRTAEGELLADRVVLAANAYSARLAALRRHLMPFYSYILLTEPLTAAQWERIGWQDRFGMEDRRVFLHYFRPTVDGRILWGGRDAVYRPDGPDARYDRDERVFARLEETFRWTFPQLHDVRIAHRWGGPIAVTGDFLPLVGWLRGERIAYCFGYNGHGVAISHLAARACAELLLGRDGEARRLPIVGRKPLWLGPRWARDPLVQATVRHYLRRDDEGTEIRAPLPVRLMEALMPAARPLRAPPSSPPD